MLSGETRKMSQRILALTIPVLVEQTGMIIMGVINTMLASNLGRESISAIGMIESVSLIVISVFAALATGGAVVVAQYTGREDARSANRAAGQALLSGLLISLAIMVSLLVTRKSLILMLFHNAEPIVIDYGLAYFGITIWSYPMIALVSISFGILRGAGDTRTPMLLSIIMNVINVLLSYSLIYGISLSLGSLSLRLPALGVRGAAIGLLSARLAGTLLVIYPMVRGSKSIRLSRISYFLPDWPILRQVFTIGLPASAEQLMFNGGKLITQTFLVSLGTIAMAANAISSSIYGLIMIPGNALALSATTIVGQTIGRGDCEEARKLLKFQVRLAQIAITTLGVLMLPFFRIAIGFYTQDASTADQTYQVLVSAMLAQPLLWSLAFVAPYGLRAAGDVRYTLTVAMLSMWLFRVLLGYVLIHTFHLGLVWLWIAMYTDWAFRAVMFRRRLNGDRWLQCKVID